MIRNINSEMTETYLWFGHSNCGLPWNDQSPTVIELNGWTDEPKEKKKKTYDTSVVSRNNQYYVRVFRNCFRSSFVHDDNGTLINCVNWLHVYSNDHRTWLGWTELDCLLSWFFLLICRKFNSFSMEIRPSLFFLLMILQLKLNIYHDKYPLRVCIILFRNVV